MAVNRTVYGASGAAQGSVVFQNGKLRIQYGTAPAWTDYITIDSAGLITLPGATAAASGLAVGNYSRIWSSSTVGFTLTSGTQERYFFNDGTHRWKNSSGVLLFSVDTQAAVFNLAAANGQALNIKHLTELTTIAAAATTDTTIEIPADVEVKAVSVRVTTAIPTAATFTVTGATSGTTFNTAAVDVAANTTNKGNASPAYKNGAAQAIRITPNLTPADNTGRVRVTIYYTDITPPTS